MGARRDYSDAEREFVTTDKSYRKLGEEYGVSFSFLAEKGKKEDWVGKREAYKAAVARRAYEHAAVAVADEQSTVQKESILVARAYIRKFAHQLTQSDFKTNAKDALEFIRLLANELAPPGDTNGPRVIDGTAVHTGGDPDVLRRIVEMARERVAPAGALGPASPIESERARPN